MADPNDMTALQAVLSELQAKLAELKEKRKAAAPGLKHPEWESKAEIQAHLAVVKAELSIAESRLPDLRLASEAAIDSHIEHCYREIRRLKDGNSVSTGELDTDSLLGVVQVMNECIARIDELNMDIEDIQNDLNDDDLWEDN